MNVGRLLDDAAARDPQGRALIAPRLATDRILTFQELLRRCDAYAHGLRTYGMRPGDRILLMVKDGPTFIALTFALFKLGAQPVLLDPGMGLKPLTRCIQRLRPDGLVGVRAAHALRLAFPSAFEGVRRAVCVDGKWPGAASLERIQEREAGPFHLHEVGAQDPAAILFTSGSTGPAKGVVYRHGIFRAQVEALRQMFNFRPGQLDMPGFPLFALFSVALGQTCVLPELNPSRPASAQPARLVRSILDWRVASLQGSPAIWSRVGDYCQEHRIQLPSVERVITFGAPISLDMVRLWKGILGQTGEIYTPYGATEALPVACISGQEILDLAERTRLGAGTCVGHPAPGARVRIAATRDEAIDSWEGLELPAGQVGEICAQGEVVTWTYDGLPEATALSKITEGNEIWHRMGDLGYLDPEGRLWIVGRKSERIQGPERTCYPVCAEGMVNEHPEVRRSALVGVGAPGHQEPVLVVEPAHKRLLKDTAEQHRVARELRGRLEKHPDYALVKRVLYHPSFPVDPRHNAKIHREELAKWAGRNRP